MAAVRRLSATRELLKQSSFPVSGELNVEVLFTEGGMFSQGSDVMATFHFNGQSQKVGFVGGSADTFPKSISFDTEINAGDPLHIVFASRAGGDELGSTGYPDVVKEILGQQKTSRRSPLIVKDGNRRVGKIKLRVACYPGGRTELEKETGVQRTRIGRVTSAVWWYHNARRVCSIVTSIPIAHQLVELVVSGVNAVTDPVYRKYFHDDHLLDAVDRSLDGLACTIDDLVDPVKLQLAAVTDQIPWVYGLPIVSTTLAQ